MILRLTGAIPGKARPRVTSRGTHMPRAYRQWQAAALAELATQRPVPVSGVAVVRVDLVYPAPKNRPARSHPARAWWVPYSEQCTPFHWPGKPDIDNAAGSVLDVLTRAGVIEDDRLVVALAVTRRASHHAEDVGAVVTVCGGEE